mmetsp:Transcript_172605/g.548072  ORF Transcript_172605/g.548072 Transcript_172605/m.548072 type:complete len:81 (-) Transcript_172605:999-1241(-)
MVAAELHEVSGGVNKVLIVNGLVAGHPAVSAVHNLALAEERQDRISKRGVRSSQQKDFELATFQASAAKCLTNVAWTRHL